MPGGSMLRFSPAPSPPMRTTRRPKLSSNFLCLRMPRPPSATALRPGDRKQARSLSMSSPMEATMRAASDTIAQLAAAMAKAQSELVNPVKSLTAVIESNRNGGGAISYKYAPLSSGLDIVRKTLGKYELAAIQTTHVDRERGLLLLTTTIAHASGEWISALWPVCHVADIGHPKLMGAALTYARRYCLFTIVGLAGEDDLDAPDLYTGEQPPNEASPTPTGTGLDAVPPESTTQLGVSAEVNGKESPSGSIESDS